MLLALMTEVIVLGRIKSNFLPGKASFLKCVCDVPHFSDESERKSAMALSGRQFGNIPSTGILTPPSQGHRNLEAVVSLKHSNSHNLKGWRSFICCVGTRKTKDFKVPNGPRREVCIQLLQCTAPCGPEATSNSLSHTDGSSHQIIVGTIRIQPEAGGARGSPMLSL